MSEILKTWENNEILKQNESAEKLKNIQELENILNPDSLEKQNYLAEQTEKCCKALNENFSNLFLNWKTKDWNRYDFYAALNKTVKNPIS